MYIAAWYQSELRGGGGSVGGAICRMYHN